jgi:hypothetical protein
LQAHFIIMRWNVFIVIFLAGIVMEAVAFRSSAQVVVIPVQNASFELNSLGVNSYTNNAITDWTIDGSANFGAGVQSFTTASFSAAQPFPSPASGSQAAYIKTGEKIYQDVGTLLANTTYTLTLAVGQRLEAGNQGGGIFKLINGTTDLGTVLVTSTLSLPTAGTFTSQSITFTSGATVSGDLTIALFQSSGAQVVFDNIQLTALSVPEPQCWVLLIVGVAFFVTLWVRRFRKPASSI